MWAPGLQLLSVVGRVPPRGAVSALTDNSGMHRRRGASPSGCMTDFFGGDRLEQSKQRKRRGGGNS